MMRHLRYAAGKVLPEWIKRTIRPQLFGYRNASVGRDWVLDERETCVELQACGLTARFPTNMRDALQYHCIANGESIEELHGFVAHARQNGGLLFDVGAADGLFSILHCLSNTSNRAIAFEPSDVLAARIPVASKLNDLNDRITVLEAAVGRTQSALSADVSSCGMLVIGPSSGDKMIEVVTLDDMIEKFGVPTVIKIDVEGYEAEVLAGAHRVLADCGPTLFLELHLDMLENKGIPASRLTRLLSDCGYKFETSLGRSLSARQIASSARAVIRFVAKSAKGVKGFIPR
ncbi:MAG: FkbM family methyltransferase [Planctomycetaceae bacterium]|nr:FkbM family methyltransferase [Planctomycetaceae bacterium]